MLEKMRNAWRIPALRSKILYTLGMLLVYRLLSVIPVPGVNLEQVNQATSRFSILDFMSMMTVLPSGRSLPGRPMRPSNPRHLKESTSDGESRGTTRLAGGISKTRKLRLTNYGNR